MGRPHGVLFVCSGNTCRSPAAAALLAARVEWAADWLIDSAGLRSGRGQPANPKMAAVLARRGLDLSRHRSQPVEDVAFLCYPLILVMEAGQREDMNARFPTLSGKVYTLAEVCGGQGDVADPFGASEQVYEQIASQIEDLIGRGIGEIRRLSQD